MFQYAKRSQCIDSSLLFNVIITIKKGIVIIFTQEHIMEGEEDIDKLIEEANAQAKARDDARAAAEAESRMEIEEEEEQEDRGEVKAVAPGDDVTDVVFSKVVPSSKSSGVAQPLLCTLLPSLSTSLLRFLS